MHGRSNTAERLPAPERSGQTRLFDDVNRRHAREILAMDPGDVCLFLPHCLRSRDCPAERDEEGIHCRHCGACAVDGLVSAAEGCGVRVFCVPGGSLVKSLVSRYRPRALIGVACAKEIQLALDLFGDGAFAIQVFPLGREGCVETALQPEPLLDFLDTLRARHAERQAPPADEGPDGSGPFWSRLIPRQFDDRALARLCGETAYAYDTVGPSKALSEPLWDFLSRGGKGKRSRLLSLILQAYGVDPEPFRPYMLVPELSHNGTLIIDDIEDDSSHRRGKPCVHHLYGTDVAMNAGNALYFLPLLPLFRDGSSLSEGQRNEIFSHYVQAMLRLHFGQSMDIAWHRGLLGVEEITEEKYLQMCGLKTGSLYWMSARIAAVLAGLPGDTAERLGAFAQAIGIAFQIKDDLLDLQGERFAAGKGGPGKDITEGKITLMVIHAVHRAPEEEARRLREILALHTGDPGLIREAVTLLERSGAMAYAEDRAEQILRGAYRRVEPLIPPGPFKAEIESFAASLVRREL